MGQGGISTVVHQLFLPVTVFALVISVAWRFVGHRRLRTMLQIVASLLFFAPQLAVFWLWNQSILLVFYEDATIAFWALALAIVLWRRTIFLGRGGEPPLGCQRLRSSIVTAVLAIAFTGFAIMTAKTFFLDTFAPRTVIDGRVEQLWITSGPRQLAVHRYAIVDGRSFQVPADVFARLQRGDVIHGEIGAGSQTLLALDRVQRL